VIATPYGAHALGALRDVVRDTKADDPMAPVTLLVPNNLAGIVARRHLARGLSADRDAVAGIQVTTLARLAEQVAAASMTPRRPATNAVLASAWRAALRENAGVFEPVRDHPATVRAFADAHRELRDLSNAALDAIAPASQLVTDLVRLHRAVTQALRGMWYDTPDLLDRATELTLAREATTDDPGQLVLYLPQQLTLGESRFARALAETADLTVIVGLTGVGRADRAVHRSLRRIGLELDHGPGARVAHEVFHASDSDDEIRCIVRDVVVTLESTPAHRVAILYGSAHPYARLLHEHLTAAGIAVNGTGTRSVSERAIARGFLGILQLTADDLPRADLFTAVSEAPTRAFDGSRIPASRWERLSRSAAVVRGDDWADRLDTYATAVRSDIAAEQGREDPRQARIDARGRDLDTAAGLRAFATTLRARLHEGANLTTWSQLGDWAGALFESLYGDAQVLSRLPPDEQYAAAAVESTLRGLAGLDAFEPTADLTGLIDVLVAELESALPRVGRFGDGVLVAPTGTAIGLDVDVVYAVGLAEDSYPGRLHEDPLLLERVRDLSLGELASYRDRLDAKHRHLLAAFDAAPRVVVSFPRGNLRRSTHRLPSRWLLPTLRMLTGDLDLAATEWETVPSPQVKGSASFAGSLVGDQMPASEQEWRTRAVSLGGDLDDRTIDDAVTLVRARASDTFTRFDGNLAGAEGLPDYADGTRLVSPTALEAYAVCPQAYLVERLLGVTPVEQPEEIVMISPLEVGSLIHEVIDAFIAESAGSLPDYGQPWTGEHAARLREIATAKAAEYERRGITGHARLWEDERSRIIADVDYLLDDDNTRRAARGARVLRSELAFGRDGEPPVALTVGRGTVLMRGSADKVDEARDGTLLVTDIKTGSKSTFAALNADPVVAGTKLQLPVYAVAARQLLGGDRVEAAYWFVRQGKRGFISLPLDEHVESRYSDAVGTLVTAIALGLFPAKAPDGPDFSWVQCRYCNPDGVGHGDARARYERKRRDPVLRELVALIDPKAPVAVDSGA
jgi:RecB family exonuclease